MINEFMIIGRILGFSSDFRYALRLLAININMY